MGLKLEPYFVAYFDALLLQSGMGVMGRLTRPLHVPYSFGLPYSYTIPSGTRPTSNVFLLRGNIRGVFGQLLCVPCLAG